MYTNLEREVGLFVVVGFFGVPFLLFNFVEEKFEISSSAGLDRLDFFNDNFLGNFEADLSNPLFFLVEFI